MSKRKQNRIDFYNMLVTATEVDFQDWCEELALDYLEKRSFLILEFYSAFKHIYDYFKGLYIKDDIKKFYCEFDNDNQDMIITVKYETYKVEESIIEEMKEYFSPTDIDDYDSFEIEFTSEKDKTIKLVFSKG